MLRVILEILIRCSRSTHIQNNYYQYWAIWSVLHSLFSTTGKFPPSNLPPPPVSFWQWNLNSLVLTRSLSLASFGNKTTKKMTSNYNKVFVVLFPHGLVLYIQDKKKILILLRVDYIRVDKNVCVNNEFTLGEIYSLTVLQSFCLFLPHNSSSSLIPPQTRL